MNRTARWVMAGAALAVLAGVLFTVSPAIAILVVVGAGAGFGAARLTQR